MRHKNSTKRFWRWAPDWLVCATALLLAPDPDCDFCGGTGLHPLDPMGDRYWCNRCLPPYYPPFKAPS